VVGATIGLFVVSRGKWSDALIDSGREWIVPDALSRGELLYRDVVYWVGPFTPYLHALWMRVFGSSFSTLAMSGGLDSAAMLAALFVSIRKLVGRAPAFLWTMLAIPVIVFMPGSGGILIGMGYRHAATFSLLALAMASRPFARTRSAPLAGALCGLAGLCRTEWGIAALVCCGLAMAVAGRWEKRSARPLSLLVAAAMLTFGGGVAIAIAAAGWGPVIREGHLLLTGLPKETGQFLIAFSGIRDWRAGVVNDLYSAGLWIGVFLLLRAAGLRASTRLVSRKHVGQILGILLLLGVCAAAGGASGSFLWSASPVISGLAFIHGISRPGNPKSAGLAGFGAMGLAMSHRRLFHIGDSWYVGNPLAFTFVAAALLISRMAARESGESTRKAVARAISVGLGFAIVLAFGMRFIQYAAQDRLWIAGTDRMLSAPRHVAAEIEGVADAVRGETRAGEGLVVFPEGEVLNYLSGRVNPCRHKMYLPGYLTEQNEEEILKELQLARPKAVVVWRRLTSEYGPAMFGVDYGRRIQAWIDTEYVVRPFQERDLSPRIHSLFLLGLRRERH
jgi:hypothetical protein